MSAIKNKTNLILYINTADNEKVVIGLYGDYLTKTVNFLAPRLQAEKLLPAIDRLLIKNKKTLDSLSGVAIVNRGDSFTALRIGVTTANALAYGINIPIVAVAADIEPLILIAKFKKIVGGFNRPIKPIYNREPNIGS